jgi:nucleotide-binding universal stress UspA family protein
MTALDILIHIREGDADPLAARTAIAIAQRVPSHLYGLGVAPLGSVAYTTPDMMSFQAHEADRLFAEQDARRNWWRDYLASRGANGEWLAAQGEPVEAICHAARWCDLVVAERPTLNPDAPTGWGTVSRTVFGAGAPVVVVPQTAKAATVGERVLIAWNRSREAMRAVHGALPLLRTAASVLVLDGAAREDPLGARHLPELNLQSYLARHGISATMQRFAPKSDHGANILAAAREANSDLIVMGAWGHSRIAELVLGGATRHIFQSSELPLLVAH